MPDDTTDIYRTLESWALDQAIIDALAEGTFNGDRVAARRLYCTVKGDVLAARERPLDDFTPMSKPDLRFGQWSEVKAVLAGLREYAMQHGATLGLIFPERLHQTMTQRQLGATYPMPESGVWEDVEDALTGKVVTLHVKPTPDGGLHVKPTPDEGSTP